MEFPQVGGSEEAFLAAKPLFLSMGQGAIYCGGAGNGSVSYIHIFVVRLLALPVAYSTSIHILMCCHGSVIRQQKFATIWLWL